MVSIERWRKAFPSRLGLPYDASYVAATQVDNGRIQQRPALVVLATSIDDVRTAIELASAGSVPLHVKAGGHSYAGYCMHTDGVLLDLSLMKGMVLDEEEQCLTVEMGARWSDVYNFLHQSGTQLIPVGGGCTAVGVAGFVLGGGYSFVSRSYGLGCDSLLSATIVTADGKVRCIVPDSDTDDERDLFWACQGGGGGNFGVIVEMKLRLHRPRSDKMLAGTIVFSNDRTAELLEFYNTWSPTLPDDVAVYGFLGNIPDPTRPDRLISILRFQPVCNSASDGGLDVIRPLLERRPLAVAMYNMTLPDYLRIVGGTTAFAGRSSYTRSGIMHHGAFTAEFTQCCLERLKEAPSQDSFMLWMHQGGKSKTVAAGDTAYPHRNADYVFEIASVWNADQDTRRNVEWAFRAGQDMSSSFSGAYINYIDPLLPDWPKMYYGLNYDRLLSIKRRLDPRGFFSFQQSVGSCHSPCATEPLCLDPLSRTVCAG